MHDNIYIYIFILIRKFVSISVGETNFAVTHDSSFYIILWMRLDANCLVLQPVPGQDTQSTQTCVISPIFIYVYTYIYIHQSTVSFFI